MVQALLLGTHSISRLGFCYNGSEWDGRIYETKLEHINEGLHQRYASSDDA